MRAANVVANQAVEGSVADTDKDGSSTLSGAA
jgi:hypothetical protein